MESAATAAANESEQRPQPKGSPEPGAVVVDEVSGWLRIYDDGTVDRTWTGPPEALFLMQPVAPYDVPQDGITVHDFSPGGDVPDLRVYLPTARNTPSEDRPRGGLPVLLHLQGGGFCISHPSWLMYHQFYARLARSVPAAVVSVALPLAPERRLPAALDAAAAALRHLPLLPPSVAARLDLSRVFPIGDSSGANLVHLLAAAADGGSYGPVGLAGGILLHPGFVRSTRSRSELEQRADSVFFTLDMLDKFLALALPPGATKDHPYTCPMGPAAPPLESLPLPPFLVGVAEHDLIVDTNMEYCDAMKRAGKDVEVLLSRGVSHSFYLNKFAVDTDPLTADRTHELILAIANFIRRH